MVKINSILTYFFVNQCDRITNQCFLVELLIGFLAFKANTKLHFNKILLVSLCMIM